MKIGAIELKVQRNVQYTGRKAKIGSICWTENERMAVFVDYCPSCKAKILMSLNDARKFSNMYGTERQKMRNRLLDRVITNKVL